MQHITTHDDDAGEPGTSAPAEWAASIDVPEAEQQTRHAADVASGKSADDVLAELIADLDATAPDPYPGDDVADGGSQDNGAELRDELDATAIAEAHERYAEYDGADSDELQRLEQAVMAAELEVEPHGGGSPGKPRCAEAVTAAHQAVTADSQRVTDQQHRSAQWPTDDRTHDHVAQDRHEWECDCPGGVW